MATVDLSHHNELTWLARLIGDIRAAAPQSDPLLVGALARDVLLHHAHGVAIERKTTDVDLAIAVAGWPEFTNVRDALLGSDKFVAGDKTAHSLQHREVGRIDLIPFGPVESADGTIRWPPEGHEVS